jgi:hypothetical protein
MAWMGAAVASAIVVSGEAVVPWVGAAVASAIVGSGDSVVAWKAAAVASALGGANAIWRSGETGSIQRDGIAKENRQTVSLCNGENSHPEESNEGFV